ncbi:MAG: type II toxin-antitoxin system HicA family toxin [Limisphaerales bacterium]
MPGLKPVRSGDLEKFAQQVGCTFKRQKESHGIYWRDDLIRPIIIPVYDEIPIFII